MQYYVKLSNDKVAEVAVSTIQAGSPGKDFYSVFRDDYDEIRATKINSEVKRNRGGKDKDKPNGKPGKNVEVFAPATPANPVERDLLGPVFVKDPRTEKGYKEDSFEYEIPLDVVKLMIEKKAKFDKLLA